MLQSLLAYQFDRQASGLFKAQAAPLAQRLTALTLGQPVGGRIAWLRNFISVAEFLARELRSSAADTP
jgi:CRISPR-associated protein Cmr2